MFNKTLSHESAALFIREHRIKTVKTLTDTAFRALFNAQQHQECAMRSEMDRETPIEAFEVFGWESVQTSVGRGLLHRDGRPY